MVTCVKAGIRRGPAVHSIGNSLVFNDDASAYLVRTPTVLTTVPAMWTASVWVKRANLVPCSILAAGDDANNYSQLAFYDDNELRSFNYQNGAYESHHVTSSRYRDPAVWMHYLYVYDTDNATDTDRVRVYVDGARVAAFDAAIELGLGVFSHISPSGVIRDLYIGRSPHIAEQYGEFSLSEFVFIDGQSLPPEAFGEWHPDCPQIWRSIDVSGLDYSGVNSFHLDFADPNALGNDVSGNGNHWTPNNFQPEHVVTDSPTNNVCVMADIHSFTGGTLSEGGRKAYLDGGVATDVDLGATFNIPSTGKWYWEVFLNLVSTASEIGISDSSNSSIQIGYYTSGTKYIDGSDSSYGAGFTTGDTVGVAVDADAKTITFYTNNVSQGQISITTKPVENYTPAIAQRSSLDPPTHEIHFNEDEFTYTPPAGFNALMTKYLPEPVIKNPKTYIDPVIWVGDATTPRTIPTVNKVDHLVMKNRTNMLFWQVNDVLRESYPLWWNDSGGEFTEPEHLLGFGAESGFDIGSREAVNEAGSDFVGYPFSMLPEAGLDMVSYLGGDGVAGRTVAHNLGVPPELMIIKNRIQTRDWAVYIKPLGATRHLLLNEAATGLTDATIWNDTEPDAANFTLGTSSMVNGSPIIPYIAYLFASVEGFSKVFSYIGNGSLDGPFIYCGFKPAFLLVKAVDEVKNWVLVDIATSPINPTDNYLTPDLDEGSKAAMQFDVLSNGFKVRDGISDVNGVGKQLVGIALAEYPFALMDTVR